MTPATFAAVSSVFTLGGFLGAITGGPFSTRFGRLLPLRLTAPCFILGSLLESLAPNVAMLVIGRIISGLGAGASITVGPIYIAEIAPTKSRGILGASTQMLINLGIMITQVLGWLFGYAQMWRLPLAGGIVFGIIQLAFLMFAVESPTWLGANGRSASARRTLLRIRGGELGVDEVGLWADEGPDTLEGDYAPDDDTALLSSHEARLTYGTDENEGLLAASDPSLAKPTETSPSPSVRVGMVEAVTTSSHKRAVIAVVAVMLAQQLTGINSVIMYSTSFLQALLPTSAALITVVVGGLNLVCTVLFSPLPDRIGRKTCLLLSITGMGAFALALAITIPAGATVPAAVCTLLFAASFALGLGPVPFILASELAGPGAVGATQSWGLAANWLGTFAVAQLFPILNRAWGGHAFFGFAGLAVVFGLFVAWYVPESKGKRDAEEVWGDRRDSRMD